MWSLPALSRLSGMLGFCESNRSGGYSIATGRLCLDSAAEFQCDENTRIGMVTASNAGHTSSIAFYYHSASCGCALRGKASRAESAKAPPRHILFRQLAHSGV
ncbi:hypothetical protein C8Q74DRAFT_673982 [Fomes fomentarius]|nr:hypothetical protein C8Q74DRAFT_673982 [Fomes fomentarius]